MPYTLRQAASATGRERTTLLRAIQAGKLSATRDEASGSWLIEPAELHRVYPLAEADDRTGADNGDAEGRTSDSQVVVLAHRPRSASCVQGWRLRRRAIDCVMT